MALATESHHGLREGQRDQNPPPGGVPQGLEEKALLCHARGGDPGTRGPTAAGAA